MPSIFGFFRKRQVPSHGGEGNIRAAFEKVKSDTTALFSWVSYLREKDVEKDKTISELQKGNAETDRRISELMEEFREQNQKIKALETEILSVKSDSGRFAGSFPNLVRTESEPESEPARKRAFETAIIAQTRPLKRDYILHQILNLAEKGHYTTKQIENIVVGEKRLCGRTAFYDYLRELRHKRLVKTFESGAKKLLISPEKSSVKEVRFRT